APGFPSATSFMHPVFRKLVNLGGTAEGNAFATSDSWQRVFEFLKTNLGS
ncbi:MAG: acyl-CoA thioester hydrolase/BAAT C-terminal domain-containing protein, partial [Bdellovibrionota bacterium]